jgi:branched-chain amino acid transport system substrate-binding protein
LGIVEQQGGAMSKAWMAARGWLPGGRQLAALALVLPILAACAVGSESGQAPIKIGVQGPITGQWALEGLGFRNAVALLAEEVNARGGPLGNGRAIVLVEGDDRGDADEARRVAERLIAEGVVAVIGAYNSDATAASAPLYDQAGIVQITPSSTATDLTQHGYSRFFRLCYLDDRQGLFVADLMAADLKVARAALVHDGSLYAKGLAEWAQHYLLERGVEVAYFGAVVPGQRDFTPLIRQLEQSGAEAVYFTAYWREAGLLVKQMREMGLDDVRFMAGDAVNNPEFAQIAGPAAAAGSLITTFPLPRDLESQEVRQFNADYQAKYGEVPQSIYTLMAADAFRLLVHAMEETGSVDPAKLAAHLHGIQDYPGFTGVIQGYDDKGDRIGAGHVVYVVTQEGEFELFKP